MSHPSLQLEFGRLYKFLPFFAKFWPVSGFFCGRLYKFWPFRAFSGRFLAFWKKSQNFWPKSEILAWVEALIQENQKKSVFWWKFGPKKARFKWFLVWFLWFEIVKVRNGSTVSVKILLFSVFKYMCIWGRLIFESGFYSRFYGKSTLA